MPFTRVSPNLVDSLKKNATDWFDSIQVEAKETRRFRDTKQIRHSSASKFNLQLVEQKRADIDLAWVQAAV